MFCLEASTKKSLELIKGQGLVPDGECAARPHEVPGEPVVGFGSSKPELVRHGALEAGTDDHAPVCRLCGGCYVVDAETEWHWRGNW